MWKIKNKATLAHNAASIIALIMLVLIMFLMADNWGDSKTEIALLMAWAGWLWAYYLTVKWPL